MWTSPPPFKGMAKLLLLTTCRGQTLPASKKSAQERDLHTLVGYHALTATAQLKALGDAPPLASAGSRLNHSNSSCCTSASALMTGGYSVASAFALLICGTDVGSVYIHMKQVVASAAAI
jgi:hypothetical protein